MKVNVTNKGASHKKEYGGADKMCKSRKYKKQTGLDKMLVKIADRRGNNLVDARELHKVLGINTKFTDWFDRMIDYGFVEGKDYIGFSQNWEKHCINSEASKGGRPEKNFVITTEMAKHICLIQKNEIGMKCRQYFIAVEELFTQMLLRSNDKEEQKRLMNELRKLIPNYEQKKLESETIVDFATANNIVNKVVSDYFGLHYCKKIEMPKEMLETREKIMDEYIVLYKYCDSSQEIEDKLRKAYPKSNTARAKSNYNRPIKDIISGQLYRCAGIASKSTGISKDKIIKNCNGDIEKCGNYRFVYND